MKKQVLCLCLPLLVGLAACSKGDKVENIEEKKAIVNEVAEGATKKIGHDDFVFDLSFAVDGELTFPEGKLVMDGCEIEAQGEFDFPDTLEKGSDISKIKAHIGVETDGDISFTKGSSTTNVDCDSKFADFYFQGGTIYADIYKNGFSEFLLSLFELGLELPVKDKLNLSEIIDPNGVLEFQEDFSSPDLPVEILSQVQIYVSGDEYTFELDTSEAVFKDDDGVEHNVKDFYGLDIEASLVFDKEFRIKDLEVEGDIDVSKLDEDKKVSGQLSVDFDLNVNYKANPTVKSVTNPEEYKQFKLFSK